MTPNRFYLKLAKLTSHSMRAICQVSETGDFDDFNHFMNSINYWRRSIIFADLLNRAFG